MTRPCLIVLAAALLVSPAARGEDFDLLMEAARSFVASGDFTGARGYLSRAISERPHSVAAWTLLGQYDRSLADCTAAIGFEPKAPVFPYHRALVCLKLNDEAGALADFEHAAALASQDPEYAWTLALHLASARDDKLRDGKRAVTLATRAVEQTHRLDPEAMAALAAAQAEVGDFPAAIGSIETALRFPPRPLIECKGVSVADDQLTLDVTFHNQDAAELRHDLEQALTLYRAGKQYRLP